MLWCNSLAAPEPARAALNLPFVLPVPETTDIEGVRAALAAIVSRHEALRTTVEIGPDGEPRQVIHPAAPPTTPVVDCEPSDVDATANQVVARLVADPMRLDAEPPLRAAVVTADGTPRRLCLAVHHLAADARSLALLATELTGTLTGRPPTGEPRQPRHLAANEATPTEVARAAAALAWWSERLRTVPTTLFPYHPRPTPDHRVRVALRSPALAVALPRVAATVGVPVSAVVLAAITAVLTRYTEAERWLWTTVVDNRPAKGYADACGSFIQLGLVDIARSDRFSELAATCSRAQLVAARYSSYDHAAMLEQRALATALRRTAVTLPTIFNFKATSRRYGGDHADDAPMDAGLLDDSQVMTGPGQGKPDTPLFAVVHRVRPDALLAFDADPTLLPTDDLASLLLAAERLLWSAATGDDPVLSAVDAPVRPADWVRTADNRLLDLPGTATLLRALPGVRAAEVGIGADERVTATLRGDTTVAVVLDTLAAHLTDTPGVVLPDQIDIDGTGPPVPVQEDPPALPALCRIVQEPGGVCTPDPDLSFLAQGGQARRVPAILDRLADLGIAGMSFVDLLTPRTLRAVAAGLYDGDRATSEGPGSHPVRTA